MQWSDLLNYSKIKKKQNFNFNFETYLKFKQYFFPLHYMNFLTGMSKVRLHTPS
jgi:hypothetical protein